jgi:hypothetical protein
VRFFDDTYEQAQLLLGRWESAGEQVFLNIEGTLKELDSLDPVGNQEDAKTQETPKGTSKP